ncbi:phosphotransferase [Pseudomonas sp. YQ_6]|uniref:phosphotransferase n=1 Tax=Pseudomonas TaxID=286 RepID=UPI0009B6B042|nr:MULTISPECIES: phosphotransferase [Pseudomonas]MDW2775145.1 phosphotransferase [Pseudomonas sp. BEA3.1]PWY46208.1 phosphotransferase [Pseudomonas sp. RW405]RIZ44265.1 phosphotransferase [Pseudomonas putida]
MNANSRPPSGSKTHYRWQRSSLEQNLRTLMPQWKDRALEVSSQTLASNASFVNYVRHHRFIDPCTGQPVELVEKSIRKLAFIGSQEARLHRADGIFRGCLHFRHPACFGVIETPWESLIFTEFVRGKPPRMQAIARQLALGIAELEGHSNSYLTSQPLSQKPLLWSMDFFRPWFLLRPRFNFDRFLPSLEQLGYEDKRFADLGEGFKALIPRLKKLGRQARGGTRCICHMDYLRKNLFLISGQLHVIDWSEGKVGRIGFDAGAYLGSLFRRTEMITFLTARAEFIDQYRHSLAARFDETEALRNMRYIFLMTALYHCLRPETVDEYRTKGTMHLLREKYDYLLGVA